MYKNQKLSWADVDMDALLKERQIFFVLLDTVLEHLNQHPVFLRCEEGLWPLKERLEAQGDAESQDLLQATDDIEEYLLREGYRLGASSFIKYWGWDDPDTQWIDPLLEEASLLIQPPYYRLTHLYRTLLDRAVELEQLSGLPEQLDIHCRLKWDMIKVSAFYAGYRQMTALAGILGIFEEERTAAKVDAWFTTREAQWQKEAG